MEVVVQGVGVYVVDFGGVGCDQFCESVDEFVCFVQVELGGGVWIVGQVEFYGCGVYEVYGCGGDYFDGGDVGDVLSG